MTATQIPRKRRSEGEGENRKKVNNMRQIIPTIMKPIEIIVRIS